MHKRNATPEDQLARLQYLLNEARFHARRAKRNHEADLVIGFWDGNIEGLEAAIDIMMGKEYA